MKLLPALVSSFVLLSGALAQSPEEIPALDAQYTEEYNRNKTLGLDAYYTANGLLNSTCKPVILLYARETWSPGNIGVLGPELRAGLEADYPNQLAVQGLDYPALLSSIFLPHGSTEVAIDSFTALLTNTTVLCPTSRIVVGGYSQGTAIVAYGVERAPWKVKKRVEAAVLFRYTQNAQFAGTVPGVDQGRLRVFCEEDDPVCTGSLGNKPEDYRYGDNVPEAVAFIRSVVGPV